MSNIRELSQLASLITVVDENKNIGIVTVYPDAKVGIGTIVPNAKVDVVGDAFVSGIISATSFYGDGSSLSGINVSVNRYLSITSRVGVVTVTAYAGILTVFGRNLNTNILV